MAEHGTLDDITTVAAFLVFLEAEHPGSYWGGRKVEDVVTSFCTLMKMDPARLRQSLLTGQLPPHGELRPDEEDRRSRRMAEDVEMMRHPERWPLIDLRLKTQPWVEEREFAVLERDALLFGLEKGVISIVVAGVRTETFASIEQMAERWSVD